MMDDKRVLKPEFKFQILELWKIKNEHIFKNNNVNNEIIVMGVENVSQWTLEARRKHGFHFLNYCFLFRTLNMLKNKI
jgi:hypothetical protein